MCTTRTLVQMDNTIIAEGTKPIAVRWRTPEPKKRSDSELSGLGAGSKRRQNRLTNTIRIDGRGSPSAKGWGPATGGAGPLGMRSKLGSSICSNADFPKKVPAIFYNWNGQLETSFKRDAQKEHPLALDPYSSPT
jgi:hypothetical protein